MGRVTFGISTGPQDIQWPVLRDIWKAADDIDLFEIGWVNDHFFGFVGPPFKPDPSQGAADGWMVLASLLHETKRIRGGVLVTGVHFRHPSVLAHMAATLDWSSAGRLEIGLGAGWSPEECGMFGIPLGTVKERLDRFEESIEVIVRLLSGENVTFNGEYFQLIDAVLTQLGPQSPYPPICIGGMGEKRTLPLAAKYAQHWNYEGTDPEVLAQKAQVLRECCGAIGRNPDEIRISGKVRFSNTENPNVLTERASRMIESGANTILVSFPRPTTPEMIEPVAAALSELL
ncbi:MAG: LLM class flavin-dependent oxidoreductase [Acidimicrobiales bacterium]|nr:LLM class flavin-dependent oxidoreductase [Acidimicrobiales bacterium]